jgi:hypothetical protein
VVNWAGDKRERQAAEYIVLSEIIMRVPLSGLICGIEFCGMRYENNYTVL